MKCRWRQATRECPPRAEATLSGPFRISGQRVGGLCSTSPLQGVTPTAACTKQTGDLSENSEPFKVLSAEQESRSFQIRLFLRWTQGFENLGSHTLVKKMTIKHICKHVLF